MRKILLILLAAMLPLQWSSAALAALCAQELAHEHAVAGVHSHEHSAQARAAHDHAAHGHAVPGHAAHGHAVPGHVAHGHGPRAGQGRDQAASDPSGNAGVGAPHGSAADASPASPGSDDAAGLPLDGCCHASVSALPARHVLALSPALPAQAAMPLTIPAPTHAPDGPFRPPRGALA